MATLIGIGFSQNLDPSLAFKEAAIEAKTQINIPSADLVILFMTAGYANPQYFESLKKILQPLRMIGSVTPGIILSKHTETRGVAVLAIVSDDFRYGTSFLDQLSLLPLRDAGITLARQAESDGTIPQRQAFLYFANGIKKNNSEFLRGLQEILGRAFPIIGAIGCDDHRQASFQVAQNRSTTDGAVGLLMGGQISLAMAARHGWRPLGKPRIINEAQGNLIQLIDHRPAISLYEDYFRAELAALEPGQLEDIGLLYPLGISTDTPKEYLIRQPVEVLPDGGLICQGEIPSGARVHLMISDKDACYRSAHEVAQDISDQLGQKTPKLLLILESISRRKILGRNSVQEIVAIKEILGLTTPLLGMYTYGEIGPLGPGKNASNTQVQSANIIVIGIA